MSLSLPGLQLMIRGNLQADRLLARIPTRIEVMQAISARDDTLSALASHVAPQGHPSEKARPMHAERHMIVSQAALRDAITGIPALINDAVSTLASSESHNVVERAEKQLQATLQCPVDNKLDEKLNSVEYKDHFFRKVEEVTPSRRQVKKMTEAMVDDQDFITPVAILVKNITKKTLDAGSEKGDQLRAFLKVT